jgi:hypothetical protein
MTSQINEYTASPALDSFQCKIAELEKHNRQLEKIAVEAEQNREVYLSLMDNLPGTVARIDLQQALYLFERDAA